MNKNGLTKKNLVLLERYRIHRCSLGKRGNTVKADLNTVRKFARYLRKDLCLAGEDDLKSFFMLEKDFVMRDHYASKIILFYKWLLKLDDDVRPDIMRWYRYSTSSERERQKDPDIKAQLMTPDEYAKVIQSVRMDMRISALYETLYLSGARPDEVCKMMVGDVVNEDGKISVIVRDSKTLPRQIPLVEKPMLLLRWLENHPGKDNGKSWLFPSLDRRFKNRHIQAASVSDKFKSMVSQLKLKDTLILYSLRKTRATIMFNQGYDDKEMGYLFGWKPHTVIDRRNEYDLRGLDDLKAKIFQKAEAYRPPEMVEKENKDLTENLAKQISALEEKLADFGMLIIKGARFSKPPVGNDKKELRLYNEYVDSVKNFWESCEHKKVEYGDVIKEDSE